METMSTPRYLFPVMDRDLASHMVFISGPRQVGKTTLATELIGPDGISYNWDNAQDRRALREAKWPVGKRRVLLDELHKYRSWKRWLKGEFDRNRNRLQLVVTGSARLDVYRRGGDSLQGRYHHYRLHPFSYAEFLQLKCEREPLEPLDFAAKHDSAVVERLLSFSGFPYPYFSADSMEHRRWQKERLERVIREDIRDLENVRDLSLIQILVDLLPERAANLLSVNSLRGELEVSHRAVSDWLDILEKMYVSFRIPPFHHHRVRSLKKERKLYLWDYTMIEDPAARFENLIAAHLLKFCHYLEDVKGYRMELFYLRDQDQREVDFLVTVKRKPWFQVEAKTADTSISRSLRYFSDRLNIPFSYQVVLESAGGYMRDGVQVLPAAQFLSALV